MSSAAIQNPIFAGKKQQRYHDQPHAEAAGVTQVRIRTYPGALWSDSVVVTDKAPRTDMADS